MKNVAVVTGGTGFLGSNLCDRLIAEDISVICLDNFLTSRIENIEHFWGNPNFQVIKLVETNFFHIPDNVDYVLHFASPAIPIDYRYPI